MLIAYETTSKTMAGLKIEVLDFLLGMFKLLHRHGHQLRDRYGPELKRHVRFADEEMSLRLEVKFPNSDGWERISPQLAKDLERQDNLRNETRPRERLSQSSLDGYPSDSGQSRASHLGRSLSPHPGGLTKQLIEVRATTPRDL